MALYIFGIWMGIYAAWAAVWAYRRYQWEIYQDFAWQEDISCFILPNHYPKYMVCLFFCMSGLVMGQTYSYVYTSTQDLYASYQFVFLFVSFLLSLTDLLYGIIEPRFFYPGMLLLYFLHSLLHFPFYWWIGGALFFLLMINNSLKQAAIGGGDILLLTCWGTLLGEDILLILSLSSSFALCFLLVQACFTKISRQTAIPFAPFLYLALLLFFIYT